MGSVVVRYPGRACLLGEHCDWAGGASLTVPLPMGIEVRAEPATDSVHIHTDLEGELLEGQWSTEGEVRQSGGALRFVPAAIHHLRTVGIEVPPTQLWVRSDLPSGRGFSSSAAFTLGLLDALARSAGQHLPAPVLAEHAYTVEHTLLGVECGRLDPTACAAGEPAFMQWAIDGPDKIRMDVRRVQPGACFHLVVGIFGRPRDTRSILSTLSEWYLSPLGDPDGDALRGAVQVFASAAEQGARALSAGDPVSLGEAMNLAQRTYEEELSDRAPPLYAPLLRRTCAHATEHLGAVGAKFSGAGGDGSCIVLFMNESDARTAAIELEGLGLRTWYVPVEAA